MSSIKSSKWFKFLVGFLGWFAVNTLLFTMVRFDGLIYAWILVPVANIAVLTVFATLKETRLVALGILSAMAVNFAVAMMAGTLVSAICFYPVTHPYMWRMIIRPERPDAPKEINRIPIGSHEGNLGKENPFQCIAWGWATDPDDPRTDLKIRVLVDGKEVIRGVADQNLTYLNKPRQCLSRTCGYSFYLWNVITADTLHSIRIQAQDLQTTQWHNLSNTPLMLECSLSE